MEEEIDLEIKHKRQQSQDSGTYQDWPHEEQKETNYNSNVTGEFVTVVAVDTNELPEKPFVTVVSIDSASDPNPNPNPHPHAEEVLVYRLPGERLGFGLKFEGGLQSSENVSRLFIQSCANDSPASRASASWGPLSTGDEIVSIDGDLVSGMTRMDCVRALKESTVVIKLLIQPGKDKVPEITKPKEEESQAPPIPPRKFPRRKETLEPPQGFDDKKNSPPVLPRSRVNVPAAEIYMDLISQEIPLPTESESDDTGSSISTVVSRHCSTPTTSNSSFSDVRSITSMDIPSPPSPTSKNTPFDLDKVLEPFLQLEREFSATTICSNNMFSSMVQASNMIEQKEESTLKPPESFQDKEKDHVETPDAPELPPKPSPRLELDKKMSSGKKRPPPPPPPRTDRPICPDPNEGRAEKEGDRNISSHLPRLIDFVPKDRTDVVIPSPLHPPPRTEVKEEKIEQHAEQPVEPAKSKGLQSGSPKHMEEEESLCTKEQNSEDNMLSRGASEVSTLPPSFSRLPPDGHEFPILFDEIMNENKDPAPAKLQFSPKMEKRQSVKSNILQVIRKTSLPCTETYKHGLWRNDEKSEKSVRDKIAMFSTVSSIQDSSPTPVNLTYKKMNRFKSSDDVSQKSVPFKPQSASVKNICPPPNSQIKKGMLPYHSLLDVTSVFDDHKSKFERSESDRTQSTTDLSNCCLGDSKPSNVEYSTLPRKSEQKSHFSNKESRVQQPSLTRAVSFSGSTKLHSRSQSLVDVGARPQLLSSKSTEEARRASLNHLIEQRKKSMSKLRGLVIPEKVLEVPTTQFVMDLPEIKSKDCQISNLTSEKQKPQTNNDQLNDERTHLNNMSVSNSNKNVTVINVPPWKGDNSCDLPKYSPAFKRKSLALYYGLPSSVSSVCSSLSSSREELRSCFSDSPRTMMGNSASGRANTSSTNTISSPQNQSEPKSLESITSPSMSDLSFEYVSSSPNLKSSMDRTKYETTSSKIKNNYETRGLEEESDNDSAVSSSRSSISHGYSPPHSPMPGLNKLDSGSNTLSLNHGNGLILKRTLSSETTASTSSNGSTLTSGSQASCSSVSSSSSIDSRRVLKPQSVEAINRKNVLSSAKFSSGLDLKVGVPPIKKIQNLENKNAQKDEGENDLKTINFTSNESINHNFAGIKGDNKELNDLIEVKIVNENEIVTDEEIDLLETNNELKDSVDDSFLNKDVSRISKNDINHTNLLNNNNNNNDQDNFAHDITDSLTSEKDSFSGSPDISKIVDISNDWGDKEIEAPNGYRHINENGIQKFLETKTSKMIKGSQNQKPVNVNSIRKSYEKLENFTVVPNGRLKASSSAANILIQHPRVSSIDSTTSDDSYVPTPTPYGSVTNLQKEQQFGSITSLASSTSLISQQELSQLIEEANHTLEDGGNAHEVVVVILHRDSPGGSIGITLAGGADYEAKEITVHKVLVGSPAERDGRIQKGDRILSINGKSMKGLTHYESLAILKAPRPEVVLVVSRHKVEIAEDTMPNRSNQINARSTRITDAKYISLTSEKGMETKWGPVVTVMLNKDGAGLGFSLEGGKDSPYGDQPLTVKKIFTGGCAEKCGHLFAGDELISVNNIDLSELSRLEAWALMKRLPDGHVHLNIRHPIS